MYIDNKIEHVLVSLTGVPYTGTSNLVVRLQEHNRELINRAAKALDMSQADFMRVVLVNTASKVLIELGEE